MDHFHLIFNQLINDLEKGKNSVHQMRDLLNQRPGSIGGTSDYDHQDLYKGFRDHSTVVLTALESSLSMLQNYNLEYSSKAKDYTLNNKDKRGCYKRRRGVEPVIIETTNLSDDGFAWRKYGQKPILNAKHPRHYYRCTHKDKGCPATKQVQQISENPAKHRLIYLGDHTCKLKNPQFSENPETLNPSFYLSFETNKNAKSAKHEEHKQEYGTPVKVETQSESSNQYNSAASSPDPTTTTPCSEMSSVLDHEVYSCAATPYSVDVDENYYSHMMLEYSGDLDHLLQQILDDFP